MVGKDNSSTWLKVRFKNEGNFKVILPLNIKVNDSSP